MLMRLGRRAVAPVLLTVVLILFYWKLVLTNQFTWLAQPDHSMMVLPWFQFQASEWHRGRFPLWDPYLFGGQPFLAQAQPGAAYPLNWLLFLLPLKNTWISQTALHWYYVGIRILAALMFFWFCRDLGRSPPAAFIGATTYAVAGYLCSVDWPQMVNGAVWAPLVFLFQFRAMQRDRIFRNAVLSGFFLGLMWLCGHHQMQLFVSFASGFLWIYIILRKRTQRFRFVMCAASAFAVTGAISAFQTIPTAEYGRLARRWAAFGDPIGWKDKVPYAVHETFSLSPLSLINIAVPGFDRNMILFVGIVGFTLALIGIRWTWRDLPTRWLTALAVGSLVFAFGPSSLFHGLAYTLLPMVEKARVPAQAALLFHIAICAMIAAGVDRLSAVSSETVRKAVRTLVAFSLFLILTGVVLYLAKIRGFDGDNRYMVTAFAGFLGAGLFLAWRHGPRWTPVALLGVMLLELANVSTYTFAQTTLDDKRVADLKHLSQDADIVEFLRQQPGRFRVEIAGESIPYNFGDWWGIETFTAYIASVPDVLWRNNPYHPRTQSLLGIRYHIAPKPARPDFELAYVSKHSGNVYRAPDAMPRAWVVHDVRQVAPDEAQRLVVDPDFDLSKRSVVTTAAPILENCDGVAESVEITRHDPNRVTLETNLACRGMVVLSDIVFPGWQAIVDGKRASIYDAYGLIRGVEADRGRHTIEMRYRPRSVYLGGALSLAGSLFVIATIFLTRRRY